MTITGTISDEGSPVITVELAGQTWPALIDTGFNGDLELPQALRPLLNPQFVGRISSVLAAAQRVEEDVYLVDFPFDGRTRQVYTTFVNSSEVLIGTRLLQEYRLHIDFPASSVVLDRD